MSNLRTLMGSYIMRFVHLLNDPCSKTVLLKVVKSMYF